MRYSEQLTHSLLTQLHEKKGDPNKTVVLMSGTVHATPTTDALLMLQACDFLPRDAIRCILHLDKDGSVVLHQSNSAAVRNKSVITISDLSKMRASFSPNGLVIQPSDTKKATGGPGIRVNVGHPTSSVRRFARNASLVVRCAWAVSGEGGVRQILRIAQEQDVCVRWMSFVRSLNPPEADRKRLLSVDSLRLLLSLSEKKHPLRFWAGEMVEDPRDSGNRKLASIQFLIDLINLAPNRNRRQVLTQFLHQRMFMRLFAPEFRKKMRALLHSSSSSSTKTHSVSSLDPSSRSCSGSETARAVSAARPPSSNARPIILK